MSDFHNNKCNLFSILSKSELCAKFYDLRTNTSYYEALRQMPSSEGELFEPRTYFPQISDLNGQMLNFHVRRMQYKFAFQPFLCSILWDFCVGLNKRI